jgi:hypothetical protein
MCAYIYIYMYIYIFIYIHIHIRIHITQIRDSKIGVLGNLALVHTYIHACMHITYTDVKMHIYTHTRIYNADM